MKIQTNAGHRNGSLGFKCQFCHKIHFCDTCEIQFKTDHCALNAKCTNIDGDHLCECLPGFRPNPDAIQPGTCDDIDECVEFSPCDARKSFENSRTCRTTGPSITAAWNIGNH